MIVGSPKPERRLVRYPEPNHLYMTTSNSTSSLRLLFRHASIHGHILRQ